MAVSEKPVKMCVFHVKSSLLLVRLSEVTKSALNSELSFIEKDLGFVQTRDQELLIALFKSIKLQLTRKLELVYIF